MITNGDAFFLPFVFGCFSLYLQASAQSSSAASSSSPSAVSISARSWGHPSSSSGADPASRRAARTLSARGGAEEGEEEEEEEGDLSPSSTRSTALASSSQRASDKGSPPPLSKTPLLGTALGHLDSSQRARSGAGIDLSREREGGEEEAELGDGGNSSAVGTNSSLRAARSAPPASHAAE